jgi:hypothetical protein
MLTLETKQRLAAVVRLLRIRILRDIRAESESGPRKVVDDWLTRRVLDTGTTLRKLTKEEWLQHEIKDVGALLVLRVAVLKYIERWGLFTELVPHRTMENANKYLSDTNNAETNDAVFFELATPLPWLFRRRAVEDVLCVSTRCKNEVIRTFDDKTLDSAWADDTTPGWIFQYWNDPDREAIDEHLDAQNKLEVYDIASKTQVFTERYMVDWLLENSLGQTWLRIRRKRGWGLEQLEGDCWGEPEWRYFVPGLPHIANAAVAPDSIREVKLIDPACGCGHFLLAAFEFFFAIYQKEATYLKESWSNSEIVESIFENNLFGVDIDSDAVVLSKTMLYLKGKRTSSIAKIAQINVAAPSGDVKCIVELTQAKAHWCDLLYREIGASAADAFRFVEELSAAMHVGSLLKTEVTLVARYSPAQMSLIWSLLDQTYARYASTKDLRTGLESDWSESVSQFYRILSSKTYDVVVGNPPYFGTQALADTKYIDEHYPESKENLCTALLDRVLELIRMGGVVAFVTVRNWLYISQLSAFRSRMLREYPPTRVVDLELGGFESLPGVEGVMFIAQAGGDGDCFVLRAKGGDPEAKNQSILQRDESYQTNSRLLSMLPGSPFVYRWPLPFVESYLSHPLLGNVAKVRVGMKTSDNLRFLRRPWELARAKIDEYLAAPQTSQFKAYIKGASGKAWLEPLADMVNWRDYGVEIRLALKAAYGQGPQGERHFFKCGVAFSTIGRAFVARAHKYPSLFDVAGSSVFPEDVASTVCLLNSRFAREVVETLNPTINFQVGDVGRVPYRPDPEASQIFSVIKEAFSEHERVVETSVKFEAPNPSPWEHAQRWAKIAVDRSEGEPLPPYCPEVEAPEPEAYLSYGVGVALGRFVRAGEKANESGYDDPSDSGALNAGTLNAGILYLSSEGRDSLEDPACHGLSALWKIHGGQVRGVTDLRSYLRERFFSYHKRVYENRPIYFPLASSKKHFLAFVSIHRWSSTTLDTLIQVYLLPARERIEGELFEIRQSTDTFKDSSDRKRREVELSRLLEELLVFIAAVKAINERGPDAPDSETQRRETDARYSMDLEDGVLVNSAALWSLVEPYWKEPKKWWIEIAQRRGPKGTHFDWSRVARRYFPSRVEAACQTDPVMASAHQCLWKYHPELAWHWESRLKKQFAEFRSLSESDAEEARARFLRLRAVPT